MRRAWSVPFFIAAAAELLVSAARLFNGNPWWWWVPSIGSAAALLGCGLVLVVRRRPPDDGWARPFEILRSAQGHAVRCAECGGLVLVAVGRTGLSRVLTYARQHATSGDCAAVKAERLGRTGQLPSASAPAVPPGDMTLRWKGSTRGVRDGD